MIFDEYIKEVTTTTPSVIYSFPTSSGYFQLQESDKETFNKLFSLAPDKGIGNGELSLYWLFSNGNIIDKNPGTRTADLSINGYQCEIKSYPKHDQKIVLGKWKIDTKSRYILNTLFMFHNMSCDESNFASEINFSTQTIKSGYEKLHFAYEEGWNESYPLTKQLYNKSVEIMSFVTGSSVEEISKNIMVQILETKLSHKPGNNGYVVNILPTDPTNILFHKIDFKKLESLNFNDVNENMMISSGEIRVNYFNLFK